MTCNVYARTWLRVPSPSASNRYSAFPALPRKWCGSSGSRSAPVPTTQYFIWMIFGEEEGADEFYSFLLVLATSHQFASPRHTQASDVRHRYGVAIEQWLWDVHLWKLTANNQSSEPNHRLSLVTLYFLPKIRQRAQVWTNQAHSQAHQAAMALSDRQATTIRKFVCKYPAYFGTSPPPPRPTLSSSSLFKQYTFVWCAQPRSSIWQRFCIHDVTLCRFGQFDTAPAADPTAIRRYVLASLPTSLLVLP